MRLFFALTKSRFCPQPFLSRTCWICILRSSQTLPLDRGSSGYFTHMYFSPMFQALFSSDSADLHYNYYFLGGNRTILNSSSNLFNCMYVAVKLTQVYVRNPLFENTLIPLIDFQTTYPSSKRCFRSSTCFTFGFLPSCTSKQIVASDYPSCTA